MKIYLNGKKISKKAAEEKIGKERMAQRIRDAKETYSQDPNTEISWMDGMEIKF